MDSFATTVARLLVSVLNPLAAGLLFDSRKLWQGPREELLEERMRELSATMERSASLIAEIEAAMRARERAVEKLKMEAETAQQVSALHREQSQAIAALLGSVVAREGRKSLIQGIVVNLAFFALGVVAALIVA